MPLLLAIAMHTQIGPASIAKFQGGAKAAVSLQFDDSMISQLQNAVPALNKRKLRATFFINPARPQHKAHEHEWQVDLPKAGHELANHTLQHIGARDAAEAEREIDACSDYLRKIYGPKPRLMTFGQPGGVPWNVTPQDLAPIFRKNLLIPSVNRVFFDEKDTDPVAIARKALTDGAWLQLGMHGTGGEWLSTSVPTLERLLDYLKSKQPELWVAPTIEVYKYTKERNAANIHIEDASDHGFTLRIDLDAAKLETFGHPAKELYDEPLTLQVAVPSHWHSATVTQGNQKQTIQIEAGQAQFTALPNGSKVVISKA